MSLFRHRCSARKRRNCVAAVLDILLLQGSSIRAMLFNQKVSYAFALHRMGRFPGSTSRQVRQAASSLDLDDLVPDRKVNEVAAGAKLEFSHDIGAMRAGGLNANPQGRGYIFVGPALRKVF
jgi:hypothetical protein